jgi:hypothetical protein
MITRADLSKCSEDERKILALIAARLVSATGRKFVYEAVKATFPAVDTRLSHMEGTSWRKDGKLRNQRCAVISMLNRKKH